MVLIALAIVFAGIGAMSLSSSDSSSTEAEETGSTTTSVASPTASVIAAPPVTTQPAPPSSSAAAATTPPSTTPAPTTPAAGAVDKSLPVRVFNNSMVAGLAGKTRDQLVASGYNVTETGNYGSGNIPKTTVYYSNSSAKEKALAIAIAGELGASAEPRFDGIADSPSGVIVIVTSN
nr:LytR C-terminal domain-containing protein [Nocardia inohanensis]